MAVVDKPIINKPYEEPTKHWVFEEKQPRLAEDRRPAGFFIAQRTRDNSSPVAAEQLMLYDEQSGLVPVNEIRRRVKEWRRSGYPGTTKITQDLLRHWNDPNRERKLFFCQREAAETLIWLVEAPLLKSRELSYLLTSPTTQRA
jgi:type III restriction enzyme